MDRAALIEEGRRLASERDDLIAAGVNPAELLIPLCVGGVTTGTLPHTLADLWLAFDPSAYED